MMKIFVEHNSGNNEWYTPIKYIELVRKVLGAIDLDPASCEYANKTVGATKFFTSENDGLKKNWHGRVFLNPPYGRKLIGKFIDKLKTEFVQGHISECIVLINNATETTWFNDITEIASAVVFTHGRIKFNSEIKESKTPLQGQAFLYIGKNAEKFLEVFQAIGWGALIKHAKHERR